LESTQAKSTLSFVNKLLMIPLVQKLLNRPKMALNKISINPKTALVLVATLSEKRKMYLLMNPETMQMSPSLKSIQQFSTRRKTKILSRWITICQQRTLKTSLSNWRNMESGPLN
jgi:hypothetical protein